MSMRNRSPRGPVRSRPRPKRSYGWLNSTLINQTTVVGGVTTFDLLGGLTVAEKRNVARVDRCFGDFMFRGQNANTALAGRFGLIVVTDDAMAALVVPDPLNDDESSWYWNQVLLWDEPTVEYARVRMDAKTRRRIPQSSTMAFVCEVTAGQTMDWHVGLRLLYLMT